MDADEADLIEQVREQANLVEQLKRRYENFKTAGDKALDNYLEERKTLYELQSQLWETLT